MIASWIGGHTALALTAVGTLVLAGAAIVALLNLRDARRTRHAGIVTDLSRRWDEPLAMDSRRLNASYDTDGLRDLIALYYAQRGTPKRAQQKDVEAFFDLQGWINLIETIGVLRSERAVSARVIFKLWGATIATTWEKWELPIKDMRRLEEHPGVYKNFERLAKSMSRRMWWERLVAEQVTPTD
jgi:hypothetical protein